MPTHRLTSVSVNETALASTNAETLSLPSSSPQLVEILERAEKQAHRASQIVWHLREFLGKEDQGFDVQIVGDGPV